MRQLRILATSVAGLSAAVEEAVGHFETTITSTVLGAVRERITAEVAAAVGAGGGGGGGGAAALVAKRADVDLGALPKREHWVHLVDADVSPTSRIFAVLAPTAPGKAADEAGMDVVDVWAVPGDGVLDVRLRGLTGRISRAFSIDYLVSGG